VLATWLAFYFSREQLDNSIFLHKGPTTRPAARARGSARTRSSFIQATRRREIIATFFFISVGGWASAPDGPYVRVGPVLQGRGSTAPRRTRSGKSYHGRGPMHPALVELQLRSWSGSRKTKDFDIQYITRLQVTQWQI
jgi:hypothetical protein